LNLQPLLKAPQMRQLDQRVSIRYQLRPLSRDEVAAYVSHRLTVAGGSASVVFLPRAIDMVYRHTKGIPRLVNLVCDRALLAAFSARSSRVSPEIVLQAAETLELVDESPTRFGWLNRRASVYVAAAGASVSIAIAGSMVALRTPLDAEGTRAVAVAPEIGVVAVERAPEPVAVAPTVEGVAPVATAGTSGPARYSVLTASFPIADLQREDSAAATRFEAVVNDLRGLGYDVRSMDVSLRGRGEWRRVLVGEFANFSDAQAEAHRVHQTPGFADAQVIRY
jgi:general secretion pathway protein A